MNTSILLFCLACLCFVGCKEQPVDGAGGAIVKPLDHKSYTKPQVDKKVLDKKFLDKNLDIKTEIVAPDMLLDPQTIVSPDMIQRPPD